MPRQADLPATTIEMLPSIVLMVGAGYAISIAIKETMQAYRVPVAVLISTGLLTNSFFVYKLGNDSLEMRPFIRLADHFLTNLIAHDNAWPYWGAKSLADIIYVTDREDLPKVMKLGNMTSLCFMAGLAATYVPTVNKSISACGILFVAITAVGKLLSFGNMANPKLERFLVLAMTGTAISLFTGETGIEGMGRAFVAMNTAAIVESIAPGVIDRLLEPPIRILSMLNGIA